jgi:tetratricopeptide (TPR) repeat protein
MQSPKPGWRRLAMLLAPGPAAGDGRETEPKKPLDLLIAIANAARFGDVESLRVHTHRFDSLPAKADACPPTLRILATLLADSVNDPNAVARALTTGKIKRAPLEALTAAEPGARARQTLQAVPPGKLPGTLRAAAMSLAALEDRSKQRQQAGRLLRASLALHMGLRGLARRIAMELLRSDATCQWAALLAAAARPDSQGLRDVISILKPPTSAAKASLEAELLLREGKHEPAAESFRRAAELVSETSDLRLKEAIATEKAGRLTEALGLYRQVASGGAGDIAATAANNAAYIVAQLWPDDKKRLLQAYRWSAAAVSASTNVATFHDTRGWIAHLLGRNDEACLELRRALRGMRDSPDVHAHLAAVERALGNHDLARWHNQAAERLADEDVSNALSAGLARGAGGHAKGTRQP